VARAEAAAPGWIARAARSVASPIAMAVLTTVIGFLSLLTTSIRQTREFAVIASFGSLACAFLALFFLPAMYALLGPPWCAPTGPVAPSSGPCAGWRPSAPAIPPRCWECSRCGGALRRTFRLLAFNTDPASYFPKGDPVLRDMSAIYGEAGGTNRWRCRSTRPGSRRGTS